jgi:hypothetical protein
MKRGREDDVVLVQELPRAPREYCTLDDEEASVALIHAILLAEEGQRAQTEEVERRSLAMVQQLQAEQVGEQKKEEDPSLALARRYSRLPLKLLAIFPKPLL